MPPTGLRSVRSNSQHQRDNFMMSDKPKANLFVKDSSPMVFHLPPGSTKKKIAPVVKQFGGEITSKRLRNTICLADEKLWASPGLLRDSDLYWPTYIMDCVKEKTLLDIEQYRCTKGTQLMRKLHPVNDSDLEEKNDPEEDQMWDIDDGMAPAKTIIRVPVAVKGRMKYTKAEDMKIIKYLIDNHVYDKAKGIAVWNTMANLQQGEATKQNTPASEHGIHKNEIMRNRPQYIASHHPLFLMRRLTLTVEEVCKNITQHSAQSMMTRYRDVIIKQLDQYNIPNGWKSRLTGDLKYACAARTQQDDEDKNETELDQQISCVLLANTRDKEDHAPEHQPSKVMAGVEDSSEVISESYGDEDDFDRNLLEMATNMPTGENVDEVAQISNESPGSSGSQSQVEKRLVTPKPFTSEDISEKLGNTQAKKRHVDCDADSYVSCSSSEADTSQNVLDISLSRKVSSRKRDGSGSSLEAGYRRSPRKGRQSPLTQKTGRTSPRKHNTNAVEEARHQNISKKKDTTGTLAKTHFMESPVGVGTSTSNIQQKDRSHLVDTGISEQAEEYSHSRSMKQRKTNPLKRKSGASVAVTSHSKAVRVDPMLQAAASSKEMNSFVDENNAEDAEEQVSSKRAHKRMTVRDVVKSLSAQFGLTQSQVRTLLIRNSGHAEATCYWIMTGRCLPGHHYWSPRDDKILLTHSPDHENWQILEKKRGLPVVLERIHWLQAKD